MEKKDPFPLEPKSAFYYFKRAIEIVKLNSHAMEEIGRDDNALRFGLAITAIGGSLTVIAKTGIAGLIVFALFAIAALFLFVGMVHLLAGYSKGKEEFLGLVRITALSGILDWLAVIPFIALFVTVWSVVVAVVATRQVYGLATGKAAFCVLVGAFILWAMALPLLNGPLGRILE